MGSYLKIRTEVDKDVAKLDRIHAKHMKCTKGCAKCCINFSIFPVEFFSIKEQIEKEYPEVLSSKPNKKRKQCAFLKDNACTIYNCRPIICRTHGYPLLNMNNTGDAWELSYCELNFRNILENYFSSDNCYVQDKYNSKLFMANQQFIQAHPGLIYKETDLIPLKHLFVK